MNLFTYSEAAKRLSIGERTLDRLISCRDIATVRVRGARRISDVEIDRFIKANTEPTRSVVSQFRGSR